MCALCTGVCVCVCIRVYVCMRMCVPVVGILNKDGSINNASSIKRLAEVAVAYAKAGRIDLCLIKGLTVQLKIHSTLVSRVSCNFTIRHDGQSCGCHQNSPTGGWTRRQGTLTAHSSVALCSYSEGAYILYLHR